MLDEVDAPLDGANVERFADLLREFGERSQFIVITHNPVTMEAAPVWYGVTMQEAGISRILSMQAPAAPEENIHDNGPARAGNGRRAAAPSNRRHDWIEWPAAAALFVLLTLWYTDPLWRHPGTYLVDPGDPLEHVCISWWLSRSWLSGHFAGMWDLPPIFYPAHLTLAYTDPQLGVTLLGLPVYAATHNIVAAYNFVVLVSFPLAHWGHTRWRGTSVEAGRRAVLRGRLGLRRLARPGRRRTSSCCRWSACPGCCCACTATRRRAGTRYLVGLFLLWTAQEYLCEYWGMFLILLIVPCALVLLRVSAGLAWRDTGKALAAIGLAVLAWLPAQIPFLALARWGSTTPTG